MNDDNPKQWDEQEEPPPTEEELREAQAFASKVDRLLRGEPTRSAQGDLTGGEDVGPPDELTTAARLLRASVREEHLSEQRRDELIEQAMLRTLAQPMPAPRSRARRLAPVLALAASLVLVIGAALLVWREGPAGRHADATGQVPRQMVSRTSDDLMGRPFEDRAGASGRLDLVYADRLNGYRQVLLARGTP
jgi:hypothetical protein